MDNLPQSVQDIIALVGLDAALAFVRAFGGRGGLKVPMTRTDGAVGARLVATMGPAAAERFMGCYGGERMSVPKCQQALRDARNAAIIADYDAGTSVVALFERHGLTERQLRNILKRSPGSAVTGLDRRPTDDRQLDLF